MKIKKCLDCGKFLLIKQGSGYAQRKRCSKCAGIKNNQQIRAATI